jgi:signal transduction histidine kinase
MWTSLDYSQKKCGYNTIMPFFPFKKIFNSVFTKMLVIILIAGISINVTLWGFFWAYRAMAGRPFHSNIHQYLNYLIDDLGTPPSYERAMALAGQAAIQIRFRGSGTSWSTSPIPVDRKRIHFRTWHDQPDIRAGMSHGRFYIEFKHDQGEFLFELSGEYEKNAALQWIHGVIFLSIALILLGAYVLIRRILRPIKWLDAGVKEVSQGNLKHQVPVNKSDELGQLSQGFNDMTLRLQEMLTAKEQLLRDVSHELRSPLTRMKVALEFVKEDRTRALVQSDIEEMEAMISHILETARIHHDHSRNNRRKINLTDLVNDMVAIYGQQSPGVVCTDTAALLPCLVDPEQIKTVLKNILENAIKYSPEESQPIRIASHVKDGWAVVEIADKGIGIEPEALAYIWEPFYRADKSRSRDTGGYGLGLSLCKTIMESHGGRIEVHSIPGKGTTVCLSIPIQE